MRTATLAERAALAEAIAEAVRRVPGVAGLSAGLGIEVATRFAGGKVAGVHLGDTVDVHVVADKMPLPEVGEHAAAAVHDVLAKSGEDRPVTIFIDDLATDDPVDSAQKG